MRLSLLLRTASAFSLATLAACGPSRLSDSDLTRLCELQVRCVGGTQASCEASLDAQRDAVNMQGCGGQFGALARCVIRADECTTLPADCEDEQTRLTTCASRRDGGSGPVVDAGVRLPDANVGCPSTSEEYGSAYCLDGCDNDSDGTYDCNDESCCGSIECPSGTLCGGGSCTPASETDYTYCTDGCDNDSDGTYDCNDEGCCGALEGSCSPSTLCGSTSCSPASYEEGFTYCTDGCDNDANGVFDCNEELCCSSLSGSCATGTVCGGGPVDIAVRNDLGYLEVYYMGEWRAVCDDSFSQAGADVACRQMGYSGAETWGTTTGSDLFWLDDVVCTGDEESLADCAHSAWGSDNCSASECISIVCY